MDAEELDEWVHLWYTASSIEEFESLCEIFRSTGVDYEDFKQRLSVLGYWRENMSFLKENS